MRALVKYQKGPGNVELQNMPVPTFSSEEVLLEVNCCGICGTDLHVYHDTFKNYPPVIMGHEFVGKIAEVGDSIKGLDQQASYAVLGATAITCGHCAFCQSGEFMFCQNRRGMGHGVHGAFARFAVARPDQLYQLPAGVAEREGALVEPLAAAVHAVCEVSRFKLGDIVLVSGPGPIGMLCVKLLVRQSLRVVVAGTSADKTRLAMASAFGAARTVDVDRENLMDIIQTETGGKGVDLAIECAGAESSVVNCMQALKPLGHYVQVGHFGHDLQVPWDLIAFRQLQISGSVGYTKATWTQTMDILQQGFIASDIVTHELPLEEWQQGFQLVASKEAVKVLLQP